MSYVNKDKFGNIIHDGDIVFYTTSSRYGGERLGKVFHQIHDSIGMMSDGYTSYTIGPVTKHGDPLTGFNPVRRWYQPSSAIVVTGLVPQKLIDRLDEAYANWRKKNGNKEF